MKPIFYDADVLSCFLAIQDVSILKSLFDKIIISYDVFNELKRASLFVNDMRKLINEGFIEICDYTSNQKMENFVYLLSNGYLLNRCIGRGEASAIALAVKYNGIIASNNTKDIIDAINKFNIKRIKTGDILVKALNEGIITEDEGNKIWNDMLAKNRYLTANSFSDYLRDNQEILF